MVKSEELIEISTLPQIRIKDLQSRLFAVHITDFKPIQFTQLAGAGYCFLKKMFQERNMHVEIPDTRPKLHWCLGRAVPEVYSDSDSDAISVSQRKYAIITNLNNLYSQLLNLYIKDTITLGNYLLTNQDYVLIPQGEDPTPWYDAKTGAGANVIYYDPDQTNIHEAVRDFIKSKHGIIITTNKDLTQDANLKEFVTVTIEEGVNIIFHEQDPCIFNGILESLDGVSFGRDEESFNGIYMTSYIGGVQEPLFHEIASLFVLEKSDFFYIKNRKMYLEITQGMLLCIKENLFTAIYNSERYTQESKEYFKYQQEQLYAWIKFLEIEKYLYINYQKTLAGAKDVACIVYLISNIHLTIKDLIDYVDIHRENFQFINYIIETYTPKEENFILYYMLQIMPKILVRDFLKETLLTDNPGNILLYIISKYNYDGIKNMSELDADLNTLINLLNEAFAKLLVNPDISKDTYIKSIFTTLNNDSMVVDIDNQMLKFLLKYSSKFNDYYIKINTDHSTSPILRTFSAAFPSSNSGNIEDTNEQDCETKITDNPKKPRL